MAAMPSLDFEITLALPVGPPLNNVAGGKHLAVTVDHQQQSNWCWAAVAAGVATFYGTNVKSQCQIVSDVLPNAPAGGCCPDGAACNQQYQLLKALAYVGHLAATGSEDHPLDKATLQAEITAGRPVGVQITWRDTGGGHFVAATGCAGNVIDVRDPLWGPTTTSYTKLVEDYRGRGNWSRSYRTK
jgi:hypothetical protein